jgi:hypothetical protein
VVNEWTDQSKRCPQPGRGLEETLTVHRLDIRGVLREILVLKECLKPPHIQQKGGSDPRSRLKLIAGALHAKR